MARNFPDFISSYQTWAAPDQLTTPLFNQWAAISIVGAALERKVWTPSKDRFTFPNLFVMFVGRPAAGKSVSGDKAVHNVLKHVKITDKGINYVPEHITQAAFIETMLSRDSCYLPTGEAYEHSSAYLYATEGKDVFEEKPGAGDILATMTKMYDCPPVHVKKTLSSLNGTIRNACLNVLACCTFSFFRELFPDKHIGNGLASRFIYVIHDEEKIRRPVLDLTAPPVDPVLLKLREDLTAIHALTGPFSFSQDFDDAYGDWYEECDRVSYAEKSEKMQHFIGRRAINALKLAMIFCASESNAKQLEIRHIERAKALILETDKKLPFLLESTWVQDSQAQINEVFRKGLTPGVWVSGPVFQNQVIAANISSQKYMATLNTMINSGSVEMRTMGGLPHYRLTTNLKS